MSERTYTLIGYRANGVQTCRGCVTDRIDSEFVRETGLSREQLTRRVAELWDGSDEWGAFDEVHWFVETDAPYDYDIELEAHALVPGIRAERKAAADEVERKQQAAARRQHEAEERRELERLRAKYPEK